MQLTDDEVVLLDGLQERIGAERAFFRRIFENLYMCEQDRYAWRSVAGRTHLFDHVESQVNIVIIESLRKLE